MKESLDENVTLVNENAAAFVQDLKGTAGKAIWLCGGSVLAAMLYNADLIDEMIVKLNPVLFGEGIPLFAPSSKVTKLQVLSMRKFESGHMIIHYRLR